MWRLVGALAKSSSAFSLRNQISLIADTINASDDRPIGDDFITKWPHAQVISAMPTIICCEESIIGFLDEKCVRIKFAEYPDQPLGTIWQHGVLGDLLSLFFFTCNAS